MGLLVDKIEGTEGPEVASLLARAADTTTAKLAALEKRVDVLDLGRELTDERLMLVAMDERMARLEDLLRQLLARR